MDYSKPKQVQVDDQTQKPSPQPVTPKAPVVVGGNTFPDRDTWEGEKVDSNYASAVFEKDQIQANLKKVTEEVKARFGLDDRGV